MIITDAKKLRKARTQLFIDDEAAVQVSSRLFEESRYKIGAEITDGELQELLEASERFLAREKALWLLSLRDYPKRELCEKLRREYQPEAAEAVCDALEEAGIISDENYAGRRALALIEKRGFSKKRAAWELMKKGISRELAQEAVDRVEYDPAEAAAHLILKKYPGALNDEAVFRRATAFLARRGYSPREIRAAFEKLNDL